MGNFLWLPQFHYLILQLLLVFGVVTSLSLSSSSSSHNPNPLCLSDDKSALLQFKSTMSIGANSSCADSYPKTKWWNESTNCCSWEGVSCDIATGQVIGLDLSCSMLAGSFPQNTSLFRLQELKQLNLSHNDLEGGFPSEIFQLGKLQYLDLSWNSLTGHLPKSSWSIPLRLLDLSGNEFGGSIPASLGNLTQITSLDFSNNLFDGGIPSWLFTLPSLEYLDLTNNNLTGPIHEIQKPNSIQFFSLAQNDIHGEISTSFFGLVMLTHLDLSSNNLSWVINSDMLSKLESLETLDLSSNNLSGVVKLDVLSKLKNLSTLNLSNNKLLSVSGDSGVISTFQALRSLGLSSCNVRQFPNFLLSIKSLTYLDLSSNNLSWVIKSDILSKLESLETLDLSSNNLSGVAKLDVLSKLKNLAILDLSNNKLLSVSSDSGVISAFQGLESIYLSSCNVRQFPNFLRSVKSLIYLDLSNNAIRGSIVNWELNDWEQLYHLNLSHNFLTGIEQFPGKNLITLDLRSNLLQGSLPAPPPSLGAFWISENKLTGEIPPFICNLTSLNILDLSSNYLGGVIPACLGNFSNGVSIINLQRNNFRGKIPDFCVGESYLITLALNDNQLEGLLPQSLVNCTHLRFLNLADNAFIDLFPHQLSLLPDLQVLILRSNGFYGRLDNSTAASGFPNLQVIDLSQNDFTGPLPSNFFRSLRALKVEVYNRIGKYSLIYDGIFTAYSSQNVAKVTMKRSEIELNLGSLAGFTLVDFSNNRFDGQIPKVLGELRSLLVLNLSHNCLAGPIPASVGYMEALESLDLSTNKLRGRIPPELVTLTFLAVLNLSHNNLAGPIPVGKQFNTFENDSYASNLALCGFPLSRKCGNEEEPKPPTSKLVEDDGSAVPFIWKIVMMGYGCGVVLGLSMGYIVFTTRRPWWFVRMVERDWQMNFTTWIRRIRGKRNIH